MFAELVVMFQVVCPEILSNGVIFHHHYTFGCPVPFALQHKFLQPTGLLECGLGSGSLHLELQALWNGDIYNRLLLIGWFQIRCPSPLSPYLFLDRASMH